jgi:NADH dehydrogenase FAD-containing subunit
LSSAADEATRIDLICGRALLPGFPARAERIAIRALEARGVTVRTAEHVRRISSEGIVTRLGAEPADVVLLATGVVPSRLFADSQLPLGHDGSLAVDEYLHCLGYDTIYGAGDCIWFTPRPLARAGVFAVRESPILVHNVRQALAGRFDRLKRFSPGGGYMLLLNLGDGTGLFWRRVLGVQLAYRGRSAWRLKDRIDRAFMHRYGSEADRGNQH